MTSRSLQEWRYLIKVHIRYASTSTQTLCGEIWTDTSRLEPNAVQKCEMCKNLLEVALLAYLPKDRKAPP